MDVKQQLINLGFKESSGEKADPGKTLMFYGERKLDNENRVMVKLQSEPPLLSLEIGVIYIAQYPEMDESGSLGSGMNSYNLYITQNEPLPELEALITAIQEGSLVSEHPTFCKKSAAHDGVLLHPKHLALLLNESYDNDLKAAIKKGATVDNDALAEPEAKYEYVQVNKNDMSPWEIGQVFRIRPREERNPTFVCLSDHDGRFYRKECVSLIRKNVFDLINARPDMPAWSDDNTLPEGAMVIHETEWIIDSNLNELNLIASNAKGQEIAAKISLATSEIDLLLGNYKANFIGSNISDLPPRYYMNLKIAKNEVKEWLSYFLYRHSSESKKIK